MEPEKTLWFSDRLKLEQIYKKWVTEHEIAYGITNFIAFLVTYDLIDAKKTLEFIEKDSEEE